MITALVTITIINNFVLMYWLIKLNNQRNQIDKIL